MAFFTRAVMAASSKNELPPPEVAQPARPSSAAAMTSAKRCLSWFISPSVVKAQPDRNTAQSTSRQGKTARWGHAPAGLSRPRNARSPRQQLCQLRAVYQADALLRREFPCLLGDLPGRDVDAPVRLARAPYHLQLAQRLDPRARRLPALAGGNRAACALDELEIRLLPAEPPHRAAVAPVRLL